jgi:putative ABC transport system ATP-binding protein
MEVSLQNIRMDIVPGPRTLFRFNRLNIGAGERVAIVGPSGVGKTTLLEIIAGLLLPSAGRVFVGGEDITLLGSRERCLMRRENIGIVFQRLNLIGYLTAGENVLLPLKSGAGSRRAAREAMRRVGIEEKHEQRVASLSPGEQQRVAVARVLAGNYSLILADEPTSSLDEKNADAVLEALFEAGRGKTMIVVSHDRRVRQRFDTVWDFEALQSL